MTTTKKRRRKKRKRKINLKFSITGGTVEFDDFSIDSREGF